MARYLTEFLGTFFLVLTIGLTVNYNVELAPLAIGLALTSLVYMGAHISGAHYNPAISLALLLQRVLKPADLIPYWVSQVLGAIAAAIVVSIIMPIASADVEPSLQLARFFGLAPGERYGVFSVGTWSIEILFTFLLALVILNVATSEGTKGNSYFGLAIGLTVTAGAFAGGHISGGAFNPAVGIGPNLIQGTLGGNAAALQNIVLHTVGPFVGAILATVVFRIQEAHVTGKGKGC